MKRWRIARYWCTKCTKCVRMLIKCTFLVYVLLITIKGVKGIKRRKPESFLIRAFFGRRRTDGDRPRM